MKIIDKSDKRNWVKEVNSVSVVGVDQSLMGYHEYMYPNLEDIAGLTGHAKETYDLEDRFIANLYNNLLSLEKIRDNIDLAIFKVKDLINNHEAP